MKFSTRLKSVTQDWTLHLHIEQESLKIIFKCYVYARDAFVLHFCKEKMDISEEHIAYIIRVTRIGELWTILAITSN
jgi:hypothetical protein